MGTTGHMTQYFFAVLLYTGIIFFAICAWISEAYQMMNSIQIYLKIGEAYLQQISRVMGILMYTY